jgi:hypothetical protein
MSHLFLIFMLHAISYRVFSCSLAGNVGNMSATWRRHGGDMAKCRLFSSRQGKFGDMFSYVSAHFCVAISRHVRTKDRQHMYVDRYTLSNSHVDPPFTQPPRRTKTHTTTHKQLRSQAFNSINKAPVTGI